MKSRNWVRFFFMNLMIGAIVGIITSLFVRFDEYAPYFKSGDITNIVGILLWLAGLGMLFSVVSQMGFFAYLTLHRIGLGLFKGQRLWNIIQVFLIVVTLVDFVYLRYLLTKSEGISILFYIGFALFLVTLSVVVARRKVRETNANAFIPTLFFIIVVTIIELIPALRVEGTDWLFMMFVPLVVCNIYQVLTLHKIGAPVQKQPVHTKKIVAR